MQLIPPVTSPLVPDPVLDSCHLGFLLQLSSPSLPIGGFSYSQGLEAAVELGLIDNEETACKWIHSQLQTAIAHCEAPIWLLLFRAWHGKQHDSLHYWGNWFFASRESQEARLETRQMAASLLKLVQDAQWGSRNERALLQTPDLQVLPAIHAFCMYAGNIPEQSGLTAYLFTWLENQVMAAIKSIPLGQTAGQRILNQMVCLLNQIVTQAMDNALADPPLIHTLAPQYGIVSGRHETQFSRLFRS